MYSRKATDDDTTHAHCMVRYMRLQTHIQNT